MTVHFKDEGSLWPIRTVHFGPDPIRGQFKDRVLSALSIIYIIYYIIYISPRLSQLEDGMLFGKDRILFHMTVYFSKRTTYFAKDGKVYVKDRIFHAETI